MFTMFSLSKFVDRLINYNYASYPLSFVLIIMDPFKSLRIPQNFTLQKHFLLQEIIAQTLESFSKQERSKPSQTTEKARLVDNNTDILTSLILEWTTEAVDKYKRLGDVCDWKVLCALTSAFVSGEQQALGLVQDLINRLHSFKEPENDITERGGLDIEREIKVARERVEASLKLKSQPIPTPSSKPHLQSDKSSRPHAAQLPSSSSFGGRRKFDPFDPSQKIPPPMQETLRKRAVDYARDYFYRSQNNPK
jgi:hypothetical protein